MVTLCFFALMLSWTAVLNFGFGSGYISFSIAKALLWTAYHSDAINFQKYTVDC